jgi:predicted phosphodiesterase
MVMKLEKIVQRPGGRIFVCGDTHGSFSCVEKFLKEINFNFELDLLLCTGDLIDRGPQNRECLELLFEPWFKMIKGNHEEMMIAFFDRTFYGSIWGQNGGIWGIMIKDEDRIKECVAKMKDLPYLITVDLVNGRKFHMIHAEFQATFPLVDADLANPDILEELGTASAHDGDAIVWERHLFIQLCREQIDEYLISKLHRSLEISKRKNMFNPELSHIYSGHTQVQRPTTVFGQTNLDTMAYGSYGDHAKSWCGLTITEPETGKFWFVNDNTFKEVEAVIIN